MSGRVTRAGAKLASSASSLPPPASPVKRSRPTSTSATSPSTPKRAKAAPAKGKSKITESPYVPPTPNTQRQIETEAHEAEERGAEDGAVLLHPELKFRYEDAKKHLTSVDARWGVVMSQLTCKPFEGEQKDPFNPFRSLVSSVLGQQVSWLAARSIQNKFCRLFFPHLPEKLPPPDSATPRIESPFPTPRQVVELPDRTAQLRGAGLSGRKVEYVVELAERFVDGRLDAKKLWAMDDKELAETLVAIRGIGPWTVDMFLIFSSKRQDVLPVGDLGIQKQMCRWFSHDPAIAPSIHPRKLNAPSPTKLASSKSAAVPPSPSPSPSPRKKGETVYKSAALPEGDKDGEGHGLGKLAALGGAEVEQDVVVDLDEPAGKIGAAEGADEVKEETSDTASGGDFIFPETSNNLTPAILRSRLNGKKLKGNIYLTPQEMEELSDAWKPYRSVACWYLWSLSDGTGNQ
ncbi:hypothetical protein Rhopal_006625-T1 [Rhodotorula paludigena]|uniref:HhH-GPD domain-containing protein n=1 Tax=Rhodotorula paludigena TaxID=86838 RepID=A0AAV5GTM4_9BASI|nr:hypothetical protein Rhopal_006625-T1 [Rhodotorula paludigena]